MPDGRYQIILQRCTKDAQASRAEGSDFLMRFWSS
jgi:hypothetical protein